MPTSYNSDYPSDSGRRKRKRKLTFSERLVRAGLQFYQTLTGGGSATPPPSRSSSRSPQSDQKPTPKLTLNQRLIRAGLCFILFGSMAALLPENGNVMANTAQCTGPSHDNYRLTTDSSGATDPAAGPYTNGTQIKLYFFVFNSSTSKWVAVTPSSSSMAGVTGAFIGNTFTGTVNNATSSDVIGSVTADATGVSVPESFTVSASQKPAAPGTPTALASTTTNSVTVTWPSSSGATSYNVLRSTTSGSGYSPVASKVSGLTYTDTGSGVAFGTTYYYVVQAVNSIGTSSNSQQASATTIPAAPTGLSATASTTTNSIALVWTAPSGTVTSYSVYRGTAAAGEGNDTHRDGCQRNQLLRHNCYITVRNTTTS